MGSIKLSFCIPTYNRAQIVNQVVTEILQCADSDIEVVVLDNGSTDDTLSILHAIKDERLVVYSNGENKGGLYNVVNVINKARGEFLVFSTDKDHIDFKEINQYKLFLSQHPDVAAGYCTFNSNSEVKYEIFQKGYQAINNIAYKGRHPTGYFFNNALLKSIRHVEKFSDYNFVDMFPFEFIFAELCLLGNGAVYHVPMFTLESGEMAAKHKSYNASGKTKEAFFSPQARLKLAVNYTKHINSLQLVAKEKELLIIDVFIQQLAAATIGYQAILKNRDLCAHYHMECGDIKTIKLIVVGLDFYKKYRLDTIALWGSSFIKQINFEFSLFLRFFMKRLQRLIKFKKGE